MGIIVAIDGPSGAGKSSTAKAIQFALAGIIWILVRFIALSPGWL